MAEQERVGDLEIDQDIPFQEQEWKVERAGWLAMGLIILLGLLGLFGGGPLSRVTQNGAGGFQLSHERFVRQMNPTVLAVRVPTEAAVEGQTSFWVSQDYLEDFQIEKIFPEPDSVTVEADRVVYSFNVAQDGQPLEVKIHLTPETSGQAEGRAGWGQDPGTTISQFIFP